MASTVADIGVTAYSEALTQSVQITKSVEELHISEKDGTYGQGKAFDPTFEVQVSGRGDFPSAVDVGGTAAITGVSGGASVVTNISITERNEDYPDWSFTMRNWPGATLS
jgi:hypothetical protein